MGPPRTGGPGTAVAAAGPHLSRAVAQRPRQPPVVVVASSPRHVDDQVAVVVDLPAELLQALAVGRVGHVGAQLAEVVPACVLGRSALLEELVLVVPGEEAALGGARGDRGEGDPADLRVVAEVVHDDRLELTAARHVAEERGTVLLRSGARAARPGRRRTRRRRVGCARGRRRRTPGASMPQAMPTAISTATMPNTTAVTCLRTGPAFDRHQRGVPTAAGAAGERSRYGVSDITRLVSPAGCGSRSTPRQQHRRRRSGPRPSRKADEGGPLRIPGKAVLRFLRHPRVEG